MLPEQVIREANEIDVLDILYGAGFETNFIPWEQRQYLAADAYAKRRILRPHYLSVVLHHPDRQKPRDFAFYLIGENSNA